MNEAQVVGGEMERVLPKFSTLFDRDAVFYSHLAKRPVEIISARDMRIPLELRTGGKFRHFDPDGGDLGLGDGPTFDKAVINTVHMEYAVQWTTKAQWSTDDKRKAVINAFRHLLAKSMPEFRRNVDGLCMGDGTGTLGEISVATLNVPVGSDTYVLNTTGANSLGFGAKLLRFGNNVNIYSNNLLTNRTAGGVTTITFYDLPSNTIQVTPNVAGVVAGDLIVSDGLTATPPSSIYGVKYHDNNASTGIWMGFDRSKTPEIRSSRVQATGSLTLPYPRLAINKIGDRVGEENLKKCQAWMHKAQQQAYEELGFQVSIINKTAKEEALDLYFGKQMQMAGAPVMTSYNWDRTRIDFIDLENWGRAEYHKPGFYEVEGRRIFEVRGPSGGVATSQVFYIVASFNVFVKNPAGLSYIDTLAVPSGY